VVPITSPEWTTTNRCHSCARRLEWIQILCPILNHKARSAALTALGRAVSDQRRLTLPSRNARLPLTTSTTQSSSVNSRPGWVNHKRRTHCEWSHGQQWPSHAHPSGMLFAWQKAHPCSPAGSQLGCPAPPTIRKRTGSESRKVTEIGRPFRATLGRASQTLGPCPGRASYGLQTGTGSAQGPATLAGPRSLCRCYPHCWQTCLLMVAAPPPLQDPQSRQTRDPGASGQDHGMSAPHRSMGEEWGAMAWGGGM